MRLFDILYTVGVVCKIRSCGFLHVLPTVCVCVYFTQELMSRTSLETQKLDLMDEVSYLKLKLVGMEETRTDTQPQDPADTEQNKAEVCEGLTAQKVLFF